MIRYLLLFSLLSSSAYAMDISKWFKEQKNAKGQYCCDMSDGHRYDDYYIMNNDGSVTLANNERVEAYKVLNGPNPTGHAILWSVGTGYIFCFAPGPGL